MKRIVPILAMALGAFAWQCKPEAQAPVAETKEINAGKQLATQSIYTPTGYNLVISDDFNGTTLNSTIWGSGSTAWGSESTGLKCSYIRPQDTYLSNGKLVQRAVKGPVTAPSGTVFNYAAGWSWTKARLAYGYIEIRASYPNAKGSWPAFWMLKDGWPPEIDIAEYRGAPKNYMTHAFYDGTWKTKLTPNTGGTFTGYHTYGLLWEPGSLKFYIDGAMVHSYAGSTVPTDPMYVILSNGTACADADGTGYPNYFNIDYFRWYQKQGTVPVSQGKAATASSQETGNLASSGNDGSFSTRWTASSASYPQWWKVDLGSVQTINKAVIEWYNAYERAYKYKIETSTDNVNFTTLVDQTGNTTSGVTTDNFSASARYVRITMTGAGSASHWAAFQECQIF